ncbi:hypothetical protein IL306_004605 [Fusarium sp. DS 682]|nr:hypothetical protein IL306_004605 [Fusarium sp. DS 682]
MDRLSDSVSKIQNSLQSARERLNALDNISKRTIATEVAAVRSSLQNSLIQIQDTRSHMNLYLKSLENVDNPETTVNSVPQISWLGTSLRGIVASLDQAQASADSALHCTMNYSYGVMDVERDVESQNDLLDECKSQANGIVSKAESSLSLSEIILRQTQAQVSAKEEDIRIKIQQKTEKRKRKAQLDREILQKNGQIAETQRQRESKKESAGVGLVFTRIGLLASPFNAGAPLGLAAAGPCYKGIRASDLKDEIVALQSSVTTLNREISQDQEAIGNLEREQRRLQALVSQHQAEISTRKSTHQRYQTQILEANRVDDEITALKGIAGATISSINDVSSELQGIKECLDECSALLQVKSVDISTSASTVGSMAVFIL